MSEYLNKNGLVDGCIPANTACPFLESCKLQVQSCPGAEGNLKSNNFSCAAARLHSAIAQSDNAPVFQAKARNIVERDPTLFEIRKLPTYITFSSLRAVKDPKR